MARKTLPLSDTEVKNAKPLFEDGSFKDRKLFDGDGLFLLVKANGAKW